MHLFMGVGVVEAHATDQREIIPEESSWNGVS